MNDALAANAPETAERIRAALRKNPNQMTLQLARDLGLPPWKVERAQRQARGWAPEGITLALTAVAEADAAVKGAGVDLAYALERAVLTVTSARAAS